MFVDRIGIHFGEFIVYFYALIILLGVLVACYLTSRRAKTYGQNPEQVWDLATWLLIAGIIGARLWHVLLPSASQVANGITTMYYFTHPLEAINIRNGGLGIPGAVIGGALALFFFARANKLNFFIWVDMIAPGLIVAQAIGRWGNFVNQELYGAPSNLPWAIFIEPAYRLPEFKDVAFYHPLFLYEFIWNLAIFFLILWVEQQFTKRLIAGDLFIIYLIGYPFGRFLLEFLRLDTAQAFGFDFNQYFMLAVALAATVWLVIRHWGETETADEVVLPQEVNQMVAPPDEGVENQDQSNSGE